MKALSVRQPWAWAIIHAGKDIENRSRITRYRGLVAIHATRCTRDEYEYAAEEIARLSGRKVPLWEEIRKAFGAVIGVAELTGCIEDSGEPGGESDWYQGDVGWVLAGAKPCRPYACKGARGYLFDIPDSAIR